MKTLDGTRKITDNLGIGVTPTEKLDVLGNVKVTGQAYSVIAALVTPAATTQTIDWNLGNAHDIDLESATGDVTLTLLNPKAGATYLIRVKQESSSGIAVDLIYPATVKWGGGTVPVITPTADAIDLIVLFWDGTNYLASINQNFS